MASSNNLDREGLIGALAAAMGQDNYAATKYEEARYDKATGTLYCQGYIISKSTVDEALEYFKAAKAKNDKVADTSVSARNMSLYYQTAIEAIIIMQRDAIANGGKIIAKNDGNN